jgi:hypothetical protein
VQIASPPSRILQMTKRPRPASHAPSRPLGTLGRLLARPVRGGGCYSNCQRPGRATTAKFTNTKTGSHHDLLNGVPVESLSSVLNLVDFTLVIHISCTTVQEKGCVLLSTIYREVIHDLQT